MKQKPKELDWKSRVEFIEGGSDYWIQIDGKAVNSKKDLINYLKPIFTQQRTELLEEIQNMPIEVVGNSQATVNQIIRLLNKKDE